MVMVSELSRIGHDTVRVPYVAQQIEEAGVAIYGYLSGPNASAWTMKRTKCRRCCGDRCREEAIPYAGLLSNDIDDPGDSNPCFQLRVRPIRPVWMIAPGKSRAARLD